MTIRETRNTDLRHVRRRIPRSTPRWQQFETPKEQAGLLDAAELGIFEGTGERVNPIDRDLALTHITRGNYMLVARQAESRPPDCPAMPQLPMDAGFDSGAR